MYSEVPLRPVTYPVMFQKWTNLTFVHWRYDIDQIRPLLPPQLSVETYDGSAWIGLVPFLIEDLRPPFTPALPWISQFPETNVRTYVTGPDGEPGVWFFTLEADRLPAVVSARSTYGLPYRWARMGVARGTDRVTYTSDRHGPFGPARCHMTVKPGAPLVANELARFLTARFRLYSLLFGRLVFAEIEHGPWPLHDAEILSLDQDVIMRSGIPAPQGSPLVHYSPRVDVRVGRPVFAGKR